MKNASNTRRGRSRSGGGKPRQSSRNRNYESGGSDNKVRGSAQQILDKFLALARDATSAGDRIAAEGYFQHAEHYYRVLNKDRDDQPKNTQNDRPQRDDRPQQNAAPQGRDTAPQPSADAAPQEQAAPEVPVDAPVEATVEIPKPRRKRRPSKAIAEPAAEANADVSDETAVTGNDGDDEAAA